MQAIPVGESALILTIDAASTADCVQDIRRLSNRISALNIPGLISLRFGLDSILLEFEEDFDEDDVLRLIDSQPEAEGAMNGAPIASLAVCDVPVCYEEPFAYDMSHVAEIVGMKAEAIIDLHSSQIYDVWMIGFMPGYPYMGSLDERLRLPRKSIPEISIPAGSVAIADEFVGVYPFDSPGGWNVIGRTPLQVVDYSRPAPFLFEYGMKVRFHPISAAEFERMK